MKTICVIGASGFVGFPLLCWLHNKLGTTHRVVGTYTHAKPTPQTDFEFFQLDILDVDSINTMLTRLQHNSEQLIIVLASGGIDSCVEPGDEGWTLNIQGTTNVVQATKQQKIPLVFLSSAAVFDGGETHWWHSETSSPIPVTAYGQSKMIAEAVVEQHPNSLILRAARILPTTRTPKMSARTLGKTILFLKEYIGSTQVNTSINLDDAIVFNPTEVWQLGEMIATFSRYPKKFDSIPIIHVAHEQTLTKYSFALELIRRLNLSPRLVQRKLTIHHSVGRESSVETTSGQNVLDTKLFHTLLAKSKYSSLQKQLDELGEQIASNQFRDYSWQ